MQLRNVALNTKADGQVKDKKMAGNAGRRMPRIMEDSNTFHFA